LDLAREYGNEGTVGDILVETAQLEDGPSREEVFLISKVWPTELGFIPTLDAIDASLNLLKTPYIDMYLLHWPSCNHEVEWMHCGDTVDPDGTWQESWRALEKVGAGLEIHALYIHIIILSFLL